MSDREDGRKIMATVRVMAEVKLLVEWQELARMIVNPEGGGEMGARSAVPFSIPQGWQGDLEALAEAVRDQVADKLEMELGWLVGEEGGGDYVLDVEARIDEVVEGEGEGEGAQSAPRKH